MSYARQIGLNAADKVLFIADGAPWIWRRLQRLIAALGLSPTQVLGLIDFYHAAKQLSDAVKSCAAGAGARQESEGFFVGGVSSER